MCPIARMVAVHRVPLPPQPELEKLLAHHLWDLFHCPHLGYGLGHSRPGCSYDSIQGIHLSKKTLQAICDCELGVKYLPNDRQLVEYSTSVI